MFSNGPQYKATDQGGVKFVKPQRRIRASSRYIWSADPDNSLVRRPGQLVCPPTRTTSWWTTRTTLWWTTRTRRRRLVGGQLRRLPEKNKCLDLAVSATVSLGDWAIVSLGVWAIVSLGDWATVSLGDWAIVSLGVWAIVSLGDWATVSLGDCAAVSLGDWAIVSLGDWAIVSLGVWAIVTLGTEFNQEEKKWLNQNGLISTKLKTF